MGPSFPSFQPRGRKNILNTTPDVILATQFLPSNNSRHFRQCVLVGFVELFLDTDFIRAMKRQMVTPYLFNEVFICACLFKDFIFLQLMSL